MGRIIKNSAVSMSRNLLIDSDRHQEAIPPEKAEPDLNEIFAEELECLRVEASKTGYRDGLAEAKEFAKKEYEEKLETLKKELDKETEELVQAKTQFLYLAESLRAEKISDVVQLESNIIELTLTCLYKLLGDQNNYSEVIKSLVTQSIKVFETGEKIRVRLNNSDMNLLNVMSDDQLSHLNFIEDNSIKVGHCIVDCGATVVESSVISNLDTLRKSLINTYERRVKESA